MADFLNWLSGNPTAAVLFYLTVIIVVSLITVGILQGREVQFWPPKISTKPESARRMVLIGEVQLGKNKPKEMYDGSYEGRRGHYVPVKFDVPFQKYVKVTSILKFLDIIPFPFESLGNFRL